MRPRYPQSRIRPKITTMPRQKTEAAAYLDIYKLVTEKKRLQEELQQLDQRRDRIQQRLETLTTQIAQLEDTAHQLREASPETAPPSRTMPSSTDTENFDLLFLEY